MLVALFYVFCFTGNTFAGYFNGTGRVSVPLIGAMSHIALRVVLSWLLVGKMGLPAVALRRDAGARQNGQSTQIKEVPHGPENGLCGTPLTQKGTKLAIYNKNEYFDND